MDLASSSASPEFERRAPSEPLQPSEPFEPFEPSEPQCDDFRATLIVSVYKNAPALACILHALELQTEPRFQIIVSEDGVSSDMARCVERSRLTLPRLKHLTQEDRGFRKARALNRSIQAADSDYLIFLDGDCVPHLRFIEHHLRAADPNGICVGRRIHLGQRYAERLVTHPDFVRALAGPLRYLLLAPVLHLDGIKNYEIGFASRALSRALGSKSIPIVGCNFSCYRKALEDINGFNEDFEESGVGEDSDIDWRLRAAGYRLKNIKFLAPVYHLHHPVTTISQRNYELMKARQAEGRFVCRNGLVKQ